MGPQGSLDHFSSRENDKYWLISKASAKTWSMALPLTFNWPELFNGHPCNSEGVGKCNLSKCWRKEKWKEYLWMHEGLLQLFIAVRIKSKHFNTILKTQTFLCSFFAHSLSSQLKLLQTCSSLSPLNSDHQPTCAPSAWILFPPLGLSSYSFPF